MYTKLLEYINDNYVLFYINKIIEDLNKNVFLNDLRDYKKYSDDLEDPEIEPLDYTYYDNLIFKFNINIKNKDFS